jgi:hypothetical protein
VSLTYELIESGEQLNRYCQMFDADGTRKLEALTAVSAIETGLGTISISGGKKSHSNGLRLYDIPTIYIRRVE